jgi:lysophospholipase L1-like esterase
MGSVSGLKRGWPQLGRGRLLSTLGVGVLSATAIGLFLAPSRTSAAPPLEHASVLWVGDSYTAGIGATGRKGYPLAVCDRLRWDCVLDAQGGTGYLADGHNNSDTFTPFLARLDADRARVTPDLVLVDGGRNDERQPPAQVAAAATGYAAGLRAAYPKARIVFVAPTFMHPQTPDEARIAQLLKGLAGAEHGWVIDPGALGWITSDAQGRPLLAADRVHPNDAGHAYLADRLIQALTALPLQ